jgi:ketosteroid isomerase-like protein
MDAILADDFTFTSAAGDDHISKATFKTQCWDNQKGLAGNFELEQVFGSGNEALVKYLCTTRKGKTFRNVEYLRFKDADGKIAAIECYFGEMGSFPSSVDKKG